jgi:hypothetical protein
MKRSKLTNPKKKGLYKGTFYEEPQTPRTDPIFEFAPELSSHKMRANISDIRWSVTASSANMLS